ncbi:hypothetical protein I8X65_00000070 [Escherichia coli]
MKNNSYFDCPFYPSVRLIAEHNKNDDGKVHAVTRRKTTPLLTLSARAFSALPLAGLVFRFAAQVNIAPIASDKAPSNQYAAPQRIYISLG